MLRKIVRQFTVAQDVAKRTFDKFTKKYAQHMAAFHKKSQGVNKIQPKKPAGKIYTHPYDTKYKPINLSPSKLVELQLEMVGPEIVSPHYQNFSMSRKFALTFWACYFGISIVALISDFSWMMRSTIIPWFGSGILLYMVVQGRKSLIKPILSRFYSYISFHQLQNLQDHYKQNTQLAVRQQMMKAKSQLQYRMVHDDFVATKNSIIAQFLINQQVSLKHHIASRAHTILTQTQAYQKANQRKLLAKVIEDAYKAIQEALFNNSKQIQDGMFQSALKGIQENKMTYEKDPLLPFVVKALQQNVKNFQKLTLQEQKKMISLSSDQLQSIRANDQRLKKQYLQNQPKIDQNLKSSPIASKQLAGWGK